MEPERVVLLVEDQPAHRFMARRELEPHGVLVQEVSDGRKGIDYIFGREAYANRTAYPAPDLVLLDLKMPILDGYAVLAAVRSEEVTRTLPIIVLTTSALDEDIQRAFRMGANGYVTKPLHFDDFVGELRSLNLPWFDATFTPDGVV